MKNIKLVLETYLGIAQTCINNGLEDDMYELGKSLMKADIEKYQNQGYRIVAEHGHPAVGRIVEMSKDIVIDSIKYDSALMSDSTLITIVIKGQPIVLTASNLMTERLRMLS